MKDSFDMVTDVRTLLNVPAVNDLLQGGKIYPHRRPTGRKSHTDIVISALGVNNNQLQSGTVNINIYAPNISDNQGDGKVQESPNYSALTGIAKAIAEQVESRYQGNYNTRVTDPGTLLQDADGGWLVSMQVAYRSLQENYKNI